MAQPRLQAQLDALMQADMNDVNWLNALTDLAESAPGAFAALAPSWGPALYDRDSFFFAEFLINHLPNREEIINPLLQRAEAQSHQEFFGRLYAKVATPERWNVEIRTIAQQTEQYAILRAAIDLRGAIEQRWVLLEEETALVLYLRGDANIHRFVERCLSQGQITPGEDFAQFKTVMQTDGQEDLYWAAFRATATQDDWYTELRDLAQGNLTEQSVTKALRNRQVRHGDSQEVPDDILFALIEQYGESLLPYLERNNRFFARHSLDTLFALRIDNNTLLRELIQLRNRHYRLFPELADMWAPALYARDPVFFEKFLIQHLNHTHKTIINNLLPRIRQDGYDSLFRGLYGYVAESDAWNAQIIQLADSELSDARLDRAIDLIDVPQTSYYRHTTLTLSDIAAATLYRRAPGRYDAFIARYTHAAALVAIPELTAAIQHDDAFYWRIFRQTANNDEWQAELKRLLAADIPAEQINAELEKRHPAQTERVQPGVLGDFARHYGDAVMPYFEKHLKWATPGRITRLLALDLDWGTLRNELEAIARREPRDFSELAPIWAPVLYRPDSDFFDGFLRHYLRWHDHTIRTLLPQVERDGKDALFSTLYQRVVSADEWGKHIETLVESDRLDEELLQALERRNINWYRLNQRAAIVLYTRVGLSDSPLRAFLLNHLYRPSQYQTVNYTELERLAEANHDTVLLAQITQEESTISSGTGWGEKVTHFLQQDMPAAELVTAMRAIQPPIHLQTDTSAIIPAMTHYGKAILPYLNEYGQWVGRNIPDKARFFEEVIALGDLNLYQKLFFAIARAPQWNQAILNLLDVDLDDEPFFFELGILTPPGIPERSWRWRWYLQESVALRLYERYPQRGRAFLERHLEGATEALFASAQSNNDDELLDFLTYKQLERSFSLVLRVYPPPFSYYSAPDKAAGIEVEQIGAIICQRFDQLYTQAPNVYARHCANILSKIPAFGIFGFEMQLRHNPIMQYIVNQHHTAWHNSPSAIRELLESPDIYVQLVALTILQQGDRTAAARVIENLHAFRALLLGRTKINTKKRALSCLEHAAQQDESFAETIIPLLETLLDFTGKRAITDQIMVVLVRLQRRYGVLET